MVIFGYVQIYKLQDLFMEPLCSVSNAFLRPHHYSNYGDHRKTFRANIYLLHVSCPQNLQTKKNNIKKTNTNYNLSDSW